MGERWPDPDSSIVASHAGAWIETVISAYVGTGKTVAPHADATACLASVSNGKARRWLKNGEKRRKKREKGLKNTVSDISRQ